MSHHEEKDLQEKTKEVDEATEGPKTSELSDQDLEELAGGAQPSVVNCHITD